MKCPECGAALKLETAEEEAAEGETEKPTAEPRPRRRGRQAKAPFFQKSSGDEEESE